MGLKVIRPGVLSLVQDLGRTGVAHHGLSAGGPMDLHAFCWANYLVGNVSNTPALEITMGNAVFSALENVTLALSGADMSPTIDGIRLENWRSFTLLRGQTLRLGYAKSGMRAYLAVLGGFDVPAVFNSASTVIRNKLGGLAVRPGSALVEGDELPVRTLLSSSKNKRHNWMPRCFIPDYSNRLSIAVIESYQSNDFSVQAKQAFYEKPYLVTSKMDRMGMRLKGNVVDCDIAGIISEGIALGSIQIPPNGQPIVLLNDRQTLGGYPKLGCVARMSLSKLAQAQPGSELNFHRIEVEQASKTYAKFMQFFTL
jgi:allophanate hydrolase